MASSVCQGRRSNIKIIFDHSQLLKSSWHWQEKFQNWILYSGESLFDILSLSNHNEAGGLCESGQQETGWSSHLIEGRANYIDWCNKNPAAELFKSWTALKARVLADNNTGHFRAEDIIWNIKESLQLWFKRNSLPTVFLVHILFSSVQSVSVIKEFCSTELSSPQLKVFWENWGENLDLLDCFST